MNEFHVNLSTQDGDMDCFVCHQDTAAAPAVLFYMDAPGIRSELEDMCRHIAAEGYTAILPDLYYRSGKVRFDLSKGEEEFKRMFSEAGQLSVDMVMRDTQAMLDYCKTSDLITDKVGCVGYCMSGQHVVAAAGTFPDQIQASASLYGTRIVTDAPNSPHLLAEKIKGELYLGFAEEDHYVEDFVVPDLSKALDDAGVTYLLETHPGTEHGFCFPERPQYNKAAAEKVWGKLFDLYERTLKS